MQSVCLDACLINVLWQTLIGFGFKETIIIQRLLFNCHTKHFYINIVFNVTLSNVHRMMYVVKYCDCTYITARLLTNNICKYSLINMCFVISIINVDSETLTFKWLNRIYSNWCMYLYNKSGCISQNIYSCIKYININWKTFINTTHLWHPLWQFTLLFILHVFKVAVLFQESTVIVHGF